jgi:hypothetical protein
MVKESAEVVVGRKIQDYLTPADVSVFDGLHSESKGEQAKQEYSFSLQARDGSMLSVLFSFSQIRHEDLKATCLVVIP